MQDILKCCKFVFKPFAIVTKCKDESKNGSNPVIMPCMVWYGMVWRGGGNYFVQKFFI